METEAYSSHKRLMRELAVNLEHANHLEVALDAMHQAVSQLGFPLLAYGFSRSPRHRDGSFAAPLYHTRNFPRGWDASWDGAKDPYLPACFKGTMAVDWDEVQNDDGLSPPSRKALDYLGNRGICTGVTIPIHMPKGGFAFVSGISGDNPKLTPAESLARQSKLFFVAHYFNNSVIANFLDEFDKPDGAAISQREAQCLMYASHGKTNEDIAVILDISLETVRSHLKRAIARLGALNRAHAIAKAIHLGLID